jgi:hypothetical protein
MELQGLVALSKLGRNPFHVTNVLCKIPIFAIKLETSKVEFIKGKFGNQYKKFVPDSFGEFARGIIIVTGYMEFDTVTFERLFDLRVIEEFSEFRLAS